MAAGLSTLFAALLNAEEHFRIAALAPLAIPVGTISVFLAFQQRYGIDALAVGTLLGYALEAMVMGAALFYYGLLPWPKWLALDDNLRSLGIQFLPLMIGAALGTAVGDVYTTAQFLPNQVYEFLLGGVLTSVLIPVLVRRRKIDPDRGEAYAQRLLTLATVLPKGMEGSLGLDSLDFIEISMAIEERFGFVIDETQELETHFESLGALVAWARSLREQVQG